MSEISAMQSGLAGIQTGMNSFRKDAQVIANQNLAKPAGGKEITDALIDMKASQHQVDASAKIIKAQDDMLGTLLDEMA